VIITDDQGVDAVWAGEISADDELLAQIHSMFDPGAGSLPRLVDAVSPFSDDSFESLLAHRG